MSAARSMPRSRDDYRHFIPITTRLADNDLYNHLNNATYYSFIDTAVTLYLTKAVGRDLGNDPVVYFVAENGCVYFGSIAFPDDVVCGLVVSHIGTSSMRFEVGLFRNDERLEAARGYFVQVCCDRATQRPIPMPRAVRAALEAIKA
ncbi:MAG TPA: thioesterase family protein [Burkholderiales bacterium]|nr:thioesterase family protein [Burkholderiales bacterium]